MTKPDLPRSVEDPDGRVVQFTERSWQHIMVERPQLLDDVDAILAAIAAPDHRERIRGRTGNGSTVGA
jgi:hypothetical protein